MPSDLEKLSQEKRLALSRLRALLSCVWDLDAAGVTLVNATMVHIKKILRHRAPYRPAFWLTTAPLSKI